MASLAAAPIAPALVTGGHSFVEHASSAAPSQDDAMQAKLQIGRRAQKSLRCKVAGATALICIFNPPWFIGHVILPVFLTFMSKKV